MLKLAMVMAVTALGLYGALVGAIYAFQQNLLYRPSLMRETPGSVGLEGFRVEQLATRDGLSLPVWRHDGAPDKPVVLVFHGNAAALGALASRLSRLVREGFSVRAMEYRGYAGAPGTPTQPALTADAIDLIRSVKADGIPAERIFVYGWSLGSAVALHALVEEPVGRIALEAPPASIVDVAQMRFPFVPARLLMRDQWRSIELTDRIAAPVLIVHGTDDWTVPISEGRRLAAAFGSRARFVAIEGGAHADLDRLGGLDAIVDFLKG
jgi:alpha-beta hydrolase superfamily lysophospholipase